MTVEIDEALFAAVEIAAGASPLRVVVEEALQMWLENQAQRQGSVVSASLKPTAHNRVENLIHDQARLSPPTPSEAPMGKQKPVRRYGGPRS